MEKRLRVLGLVPARGGSKGIPRKNVRPLCGKPLLAYTAEVALAARRLSRVVLSTEDYEIADIGRRCGLEVPFMRPAALAQDDTSSLLVVQHALRWLEAHDDRFDAVCVLQPTNPFRRPEHVDACIGLLEQSGGDAVMTVRRVPDEYNPHWTYVPDDRGFLRLSTGEASPIPRRQALPAAFYRDGSVYVTRRDVVLEQNSLYGSRVLGHVVDGDGFVNLDSLEDWARAEALVGHRER